MSGATPTAAMASSEALSAGDLPLEPAEFARRLTGDVDRFMEAHGLDESRFSEPLSDAQMRNGLYTRVHGELVTGDIARRMAEQVDDDDLFVQLAKQAEDEIKHARLLGQRLKALGGHPAECFERANDLSKEFWDAIGGRELIETTAVLQAGAERMAGFRHPNEQQYYDDETAMVYEDVITPDERFHAQVGVNVLRTYCTDEATQRRALRASHEGRDIVVDLHDAGYKQAYAE
mgnify:CR=1 FL=1